MSAKYCSKPACDGKKLFIEVTGIKHGAEHHFEFYDLTDMSQQASLEAKKKIDPELMDTTVYSWDWCDEKENRNVWLKLDASDGPIRLPLFRDTSSVERRIGDQDYQLHAFLPMTHLPTLNKTRKTEQRLAPVRDGYLYIVYQNKFWREIAINTNAKGETEFSDVHLYKHRTGMHKPFKTGAERKPTGNVLKEIWYPAKEKGAKTDILFAYSEVQWSSARLNYLEANLKALKKRCQRPATKPHKLSALPPMRARESERELFLADPAGYSRDLAGGYLSAMYNKARHELECYAADGAYCPDDMLRYEYGIRKEALSLHMVEDKAANEAEAALRPELALMEEEEAKQFALASRIINSKKFHGALSAEDAQAELEALKANVGKKAREKVQVARDKAKKAAGTKIKQEVEQQWVTNKCEDFFQQAKQRQLRGIVVADRLFNLRHHMAQVLCAAAYLQDLQSYARQQPHASSADLLQHLVLNPKFGEQENPSYKYHDLIDRSAQGTFHRTLITTLRKSTHKGITRLQKKLLPLLADRDLAECLKDVTSLDDGNLFGAYILVNQCRTALGIDPQLHDQLVPEHEKKTGGLALEAAKLFFSDSSHPLRQVLFGDEKMGDSLVALLEDKKANPGYSRYTKESNDGSGLLTMQNLARMVGTELKLEEAKQQIEEAGLLVLAQQESKQSLFPQIRRFVNAADDAFGSFYANGHTVRQALEASTVKVQFNKLYQESLGLTKALGGKEFASLVTFKPVKGEKISGYVVGLSDDAGAISGVDSGNLNMYGHKQTKNSFGDILVDDKVVASTAKSRLAKGADVALEKNSSIILFKDSKSPVVEMLKRDKKLLTQATSAELNKTNAYQKLQIPLFVLAIEAWNIKNALTYHMENSETDWLYSRLNIGSALLDAGVAMTNGRNLLKGSQSRLYQMTNKIAFRQVTRIKLIGYAAAVLTAGLMIVDVVRLWAMQDKDAAVGTGVMAFGVLFSAFGSGLFSGAAPILGMNPAFWIGLVITLIGFGIVYYFTDKPIEAWLKNGPFGQSPATKGDLDYLVYDPNEAYKQLLSLYLNISIQSYRINEGPLKPVKRQALKQQGITHYTLVHTNLPWLLSTNKEDVQLNVVARALRDCYEITEINNSRKGSKITNRYRVSSSNPKPVEPSAVVDTMEGKLYLYKVTTPSPKPYIYRGKKYAYENRVQQLVQVRVGDFIFPQPPLDQVIKVKKQLAAKEIDISKADFGDRPVKSLKELFISQPKNPFWAS